MPEIARGCDAVINVSTGGGLGMTREERLRAAVATSPEMASLNVGSLNFGIFPMLEKYSQWKHPWEPEFLEMTRDFIFRNTFADLEYVVKELGHGHGTRFEFECYDLGHLYNLAWLIDQGWLDPPYFVQMVFGVLGGVGADLDNLVHMHTIASKLFGDSYEWSVLAAGRHQLSFATQAAMLGGNLRVGMEDSLFIGPGELTPSNAAQVRKIRGIVEKLGYQVATPAEARSRLALQGLGECRLLRLGASGLGHRRRRPRGRRDRGELGGAVPGRRQVGRGLRPGSRSRGSGPPCSDAGPGQGPDSGSPTAAAPRPLTFPDDPRSAVERRPVRPGERARTG